MLTYENQRLVPQPHGGAINRFQPGESGNPRGRPNVGESVRGWMNSMRDDSREELQKIADDAKSPTAKCIAAVTLLAARMPVADIQQFEPYLEGTVKLKDLAAAGVDTRGIKKISKRRNSKTGEETVSLELRQHGREDAAMVMDYTDGKPVQRIEVTHVADDPDVLRAQVAALLAQNPDLADRLADLAPVDAESVSVIEETTYDSLLCLRQ